MIIFKRIWIWDLAGRNLAASDVAASRLTIALGPVLMRRGAGPP